MAGLASHGDTVTAEALSRLRSGNSESTWLEVFLVRLLGRLRLEAAIPVLIYLVIDPDDYLLEERDRALARIGSEAVVRWLAQVGASGDRKERMGVAWNLENIHFYLKTAIGSILKENGYATSWLSKDHNVPVFVASQIGTFDNWPTGQGFDYLYGLPYRKFMIHSAVVNSYGQHAAPLCS